MSSNSWTASCPLSDRAASISLQESICSFNARR
jgi:hypothetical protein